MTRSIATAVLALLLLPAIALRAGGAPNPTARLPQLEPGGRMGVHGMIVFGGGNGNRFVSHIPMFRSPHDFQAVFRVSFDSKVASFDKSLYTFEPERFSLDDLLLGTLKSIHGSLFEGNFEEGGRLIETLEIRIDAIVRASQLSSEAARSTALEYLAVGKPDQAFLVHIISAPPDFDQVVAASIGEWPSKSPDLERGVVLRFANIANTVGNRLAAGTCSAIAPDSERPIAITVDHVLSTLVGPDFMAAP